MSPSLKESFGPDSNTLEFTKVGMVKEAKNGDLRLCGSYEYDSAAKKRDGQRVVGTGTSVVFWEMFVLCAGCIGLIFTQLASVAV